MKSYEMYVKTDCSYCREAVDLLSQKKIPFVITVVDKNPNYLEKVKAIYSWTTVPICVELDEETNVRTLIGGFNELEEHIKI